MNKNNTSKSHYFAREKLILLESLRKLNFLGNIPAASTMPPPSLYKEMKKVPIEIEFDKYFLVESQMRLLNAIFLYELHEEDFHFETKTTVNDAIEMMDGLPELELIVKEYQNEDMEKYNMADNEDSIFVMKAYSELLEKLMSDNMIFSKPTSTDDIDKFIKNGTLEENVDVSPEKITIINALVSLADAAVDISIKDDLNPRTFELIALTNDYLTGFGYNIPIGELQYD